MDTLQKKKGLAAIWISVAFFLVSLHWASFCAFAVVMTFIVFLEFKEQRDKSALPCLVVIALFMLVLIGSLNQAWYITAIIFTVMWTDVAANVVGKLWKRVCQQPTKFAPTISPNKTWAGTIGALIGGSIGFPIILYLLQLWQQPAFTNANVFLTSALTNPFAYKLGFVVAWFAAMGDILFSQKKRQWGIKDYYFSLDRGYQVYIFEAHGGACDRLNSWTLVAPLFGVLLLGDHFVAGFSNEVIKWLPILVLLHISIYRLKQIQEKKSKLQ